MRPRSFRRSSTRTVSVVLVIVIEPFESINQLGTAGPVIRELADTDYYYPH